MTGGLQQQARIDAVVAREIAAYMSRPCSPAPADGLTPLQRMAADPTLKARADAEWEATDWKGNLPEGWEYKPNA